MRYLATRLAEVLRFPDVKPMLEKHLHSDGKGGRLATHDERFRKLRAVYELIAPFTFTS